MVQQLVKNFTNNSLRSKIVAVQKSKMNSSADKIRPFHRTKLLINIDRTFQVLAFAHLSGGPKERNARGEAQKCLEIRSIKTR